MILPSDQPLELYNDKARAMRSSLSVPEVQAFAPLTFDQIGWPHSVQHARDLVRYADWCNHPGANDYFVENAYPPAQCASLLFTGAIQRWNQRSRERLLTVRDVIDVDLTMRPTDLDFVSFTGVFDINCYLSPTPKAGQ